MKFKTAIAAALAAVAVPVLAQTATPRLDQRQANQEARIQQGVQSGALTAKEAERLEKGQDHVQKIEDKAKSDGKVTAKERERLQQAENVQSRHIVREKHDRQRDMDHDGRNDRREMREERRAGNGPGHDRGKHLGQKKH
ncbi:hypothetical protein RHDC4_00045 [Rhodocyclaceae bacterium]|nr:hypothetical protein RHDC4_00045 [Rhodocyclaceae bacterium]